MACFGGSGICKRVILMDSGESWERGEKSMLTNSMRELTSSWSPGAGEQRRTTFFAKVARSGSC